MATFALVFSAVFIAAVLRGITGFGFALAAVPLVSLTLPPAEAIVIAILLQCMVGLREIVVMRHQVVLATLKKLSIGAVIGTPVGLLGLHMLSADAMRIVLAVIVLSALVAMVKQVRIAPGPRQAMGAGLLSGVFSGLAAMPGPPAVAYLLSTATPPAQTRATLMSFFCVTSLIALPGLFAEGLVGRQTLLMAALSLPLLMLGTYFGEKVFRRLGEGGYQKAAIAMLAVTALITAAHGISGLF
ncbi:sulfite exporter TauE/SafE family protein [Paracoccus laeviglucosivorans]|uniref:Probable membrane transporter protein n=1 Tax=Paracoccus laeviglucosivorans TaxID=1197861 RepID=A0A521FUA9_9RHOB|nr:sulfite exporter TauE/SafE family protein [Paracoccus laeviglucosivorans]SMO99815.1 hypothetical protein SAMN06265221_1501 [Paracoccus laeviglucosivorans]